MKLHELKSNEGARKANVRRKGRGHATGQGKTSGRGHKGQLARSGKGSYPGFEGGQTPIYRRIPKRGFTNSTRKEFAIVNLETLNKFDEGVEVTPELLLKEKIVKGKFNGIKILGQGELDTKLTVKAHKFSESAKKAIEDAGGTVEVI